MRFPALLLKQALGQLSFTGSTFPARIYNLINHHLMLSQEREGCRRCRFEARKGIWGADKSSYDAMKWTMSLMLAQAYKCDVADADLVVKTFETIDNELGPINGLIAVRI